MAKVGIKDTCSYAPFLPEHQKYLKFYLRGKIYQFTCLPNGRRSGPRKSTKLSSISCLRLQQVTVTGFVDDLIDRRFAECERKIKLPVAVLNSLGFVVHSDQSIFLPTGSTEYLEFATDSKSITASRQGGLLGSLEKLQNYQVNLQVAFLQ